MYTYERNSLPLYKDLKSNILFTDKLLLIQNMLQILSTRQKERPCCCCKTNNGKRGQENARQELKISDLLSQAF